MEGAGSLSRTSIPERATCTVPILRMWREAVAVPRCTLNVAEPVPGEATGDTVPGESRVGFQMFTRDDKGPHLTDAGESFRNRIALRALQIRDSIAALHLQQRA